MDTGVSAYGISGRRMGDEHFHLYSSNKYDTLSLKVKVKVGFLYSAAYAMTGPARFTISEVAVDWQEPMVLQRKLRPSIARVNVQLDPRHAASKHTTAPINHTRPSPRKHSPDVATRAYFEHATVSVL